MSNRLKMRPSHRAFSRKRSFFIPRRLIIFVAILILTCLLLAGWIIFHSRYQANPVMAVNLKEFSNRDYPENPAPLSSAFQRYANRTLQLVRRDATHFDFILEPTNSRTAKIKLENVDVSLIIPKLPEWTKNYAGNEVIALTDREWNRQQVSFPSNSDRVKIVGGNGFEKKYLSEIAIANNCLKAGYWEIILFTTEGENKTAYYQGWFTFPPGHYKNVFEEINQVSYWKYWWRLERWQDPKGTVVSLQKLRRVIDERQASVTYSPQEPIFVAGEQSRKLRTTLTSNLRTWGDIYSSPNPVRFASFVPPGRYDVNKPWDTQYWRIGELKKAILRATAPSNQSSPVQEIELVFRDTKTSETNRLFISGIDLAKLPQLPVTKYNKGLYLPMGIGVPPFYQAYADLQAKPPYTSAYFSVLLDRDGRWIDHHSLGIDGSVLHRDEKDPKLVHLYLLSYERNTLISHLTLRI